MAYGFGEREHYYYVVFTNKCSIFKAFNRKVVVDFLRTFYPQFGVENIVGRFSSYDMAKDCADKVAMARTPGRRPYYKSLTGNDFIK